MRIAWLTRPDLAFASAACAQKYSSDQEIPFSEKAIEEEDDVAETDKSELTAVAHTPVFSYDENEMAVKKVVLGKKNEIAIDYTHLRVKNAVYLNKAIRKLNSRQGAYVYWPDVLEGNGENLKIVAHCDAGSTQTTDKSKSQIGVLGMAQASDPIIVYPNEETRYPDLEGARKLVKNSPYISATPIFRTSGKSERLAENSFPAELQGIYTAFDAGTVLRQLYPELIYGHPRGKIEVEIRNDQLSALNAINGLTEIPADRKLAGTLRSLREMLDRREIRNAKYVPGDVNLADALTKCTSGGDLFRLTKYNKCARKAPSEMKGKFKQAAPGKQYLFLQDMGREMYMWEETSIY